MSDAFVRNLAAAIATARQGDATALRELEPARGDDELALLAEVRALAGDHAKTRAALESATRAREILLSGIAHDLRNPLNTFAMSSGLLRDDIERGEVETERELGLLDRMGRGVERMQRLIEDLVEASRIEAGAVELSQRPESVARLVRGAVAASAAVVKERGASVGEGDLSDASIVVDRARTQQMLARAIAFAARGAGEGGAVTVSVAVGAGVARFGVVARAAGGAAIPTVEDARGGLALFIARGLAALQGGSLSAVGGDELTVTVTLPAST